MTKNQIKKFVKEHKTEIIVGGVALALGVKVGKKVATHDFKKKDLIGKFGPKSFRDDAYELVAKSKSCVSCVVDEPGLTTQELFAALADNHDPCLKDTCKGLLLFL